MYDNEEEVGRAIRDSNIAREEIFVITKLYPSQYKRARQEIEKSVKKLNIGYVDMMMLHHPSSDDVYAYKEIEQAIKEKKVRCAGISCYYVNELSYFLPKIEILPALVQNELPPYYQDEEVVKFIHSKNIDVMAWYPLGGRGYTFSILNDPTIVSIANKYHKTSAQIVLRWYVERGVIVIPGSSDIKHMEENLNIFDFNLSQDDMENIKKLNRNEKHDWY